MFVCASHRSRAPRRQVHHRRLHGHRHHASKHARRRPHDAADAAVLDPPDLRRRQWRRPGGDFSHHRAIACVRITLWMNQGSGVELWRLSEDARQSEVWNCPKGAGLQCSGHTALYRRHCVWWGGESSGEQTTLPAGDVNYVHCASSSHVFVCVCCNGKVPVYLVFSLVTVLFPLLVVDFEFLKWHLTTENNPG